MFLFWPLLFIVSSNCCCKLPLFFKLAFFFLVSTWEIGVKKVTGFRLLLDMLALNLDPKAREN